MVKVPDPPENLLPPYALTLCTGALFGLAKGYSRDSIRTSVHRTLCD